MRISITPLHLVIAATLVMSGCAGNTAAVKKPAPLTSASTLKTPVPSATARQSSPPVPAVNYSAAKITGDYAGYPVLGQFIQRMADEHGFSREYLYAVFSKAQRKQWTLDYLSKETGGGGGGPAPGAWSRYRAQFLTHLHINGGIEFWHKHRTCLQQAADRYGVPPEYILGIMGVETAFGRNIGKHRIIDALTTLAFDYPRRAAYFTGELEKFLLMTRAEKIDPLKPVGSYAGAMGLGQFMPSSFLQWAVDFNGDGVRDLWQPEDVVGSIANYFVAHGWHPNEPVVTPASVSGAQFAALETGFDTHYDLKALSQSGIRPARAMANTPDKLSLLRLRASHGDEYWLGHPNFYVITRYNHSTHYAMAVHELAQAIKQGYLDSVAAR